MGVGDRILLRAVKSDMNPDILFTLNVGGIAAIICCQSIILGVFVVRCHPFWFIVGLPILSDKMK